MYIARVRGPGFARSRLLSWKQLQLYTHSLTKMSHVLMNKVTGLRKACRLYQKEKVAQFLQS